MLPDAKKPYALAKTLIEDAPSQARRVIDEAGPLDRNDALFVKVRQLYARSIYKDEDLVAPDKFERALRVLEEDCNLAESTDGETLGLAGAIYKRYWQYTGQRAHLEKSLTYYTRGTKDSEDADGWHSVNKAYLSDVLAAQEETAGGRRARARRRYADRLRRDVVKRLTGVEPENVPWFPFASLAEAAFGLAQFREAADALREGKQRMDAWRAKHDPHNQYAAQYETTARQLANVARLRFHGTNRYDEASKTIQDAFGISDHAITALFGGKIGLALSGGGFRASLFHIGVLARLAELDLLRHVEVLSCVSGGSIVGAFYFLELKKRLERGQTDQKDYIAIVRDVEKKFLEGVQKNIRTRIASSLRAGLKMAFEPDYSRSNRVAELYQELLYDKTADDDQTAPKWMSELVVHPAEFKPQDGEIFNPKSHNWRLGAKVPILVLNATTLNNGHNWQFSSTWMGESPQAINETIDAMPRLRRMSYAGAPPVAIGTAVAASAGVPGLFEPVVLRDLFPDRTIRLVDGGVHDNQGLASLLEQNCLVILVSDASGQMYENRNPGGNPIGVISGTNAILQVRVREAQFDQLSALRRSGAIQGSMFIHLTKELSEEPVSWKGAADAEKRRMAEKKETSYGIDAAIQRQLAAVRTDLDSFSDAEAFALMNSGYAMTGQALSDGKCTPTLQLTQQTAPWTFLDIAPAMSKREHPRNAHLRELLSVSHERQFKVWQQKRVLKFLRWPLLIGAGIGLLALVWLLRNGVGIAVGALVLLGVVLWGIERNTRYSKRLDELLLGLLILFPLSLFACLHLAIFDGIFLRHGRWPADSDLER